ncbi:MAG: HAMP domain-containing sensor histidine kinase [Verrucomicrobiota bacterium]
MRKRLIWAFALFSIGLASLFGFLIFLVYHETEDWTYRKQLAKVMANAQSGETEPPLVIVTPEQDVPTALAERIATLEDGYHEFSHPKENVETAEELHLLIVSESDGTRMVAIMRTPEIEALEKRATGVIWAGALGLSAAGVLIGLLIARISVRPIEELTQWLQRDDPTEAPPKNLPDAETRLLSEALERYLVQRTSQLDRERAFLREASHELRNPINIIKGLSEIAEEQGLSPDGLERLKRSVQRMEHTVEGLLALARQEQHLSGASLDHEWETMIAEYRESFAGTLSDAKEWDPLEPLAVRMVILVAGILLHNAIQHAEANTITVSLTEECLTVRDNGRGMDGLAEIQNALDRGHPLPCGGLGLALVARICRRMDWNLSFDASEGLTVRIGFRPAKNPESVL